MLNMSCAYLPSIYPALQWNVSLCSLPILKLNYLLLTVEFWEFFMHTRYYNFVRYVVCKYFLLVYGLTFHPRNRVFYRKNTFNFPEVQFIIFFHSMAFAFGVKPKNSLPGSRSQEAVLYLFVEVLQSYVLQLNLSPNCELIATEGVRLRLRFTFSPMEI